MSRRCPYVPHKANGRRHEIMNERKNDIFIFDKDIPVVIEDDNQYEASLTFIDIASGYEIEGENNLKVPNETVYTKRYRELVECGNEWLSYHQEWELVFCETVKTFMKLNDKILFTMGKYNIDLNMQMIVYRMWLKLRTELDSRKDKNSKESSIQIEYMDFIPSKLEGSDNKFERLDDLIKKINQKMNNKEINGRIINVQTINVPANNEWIVDPEETDPKTDSKYLFCMRVFYEVGAAGDVSVGVTDFIPNHLSGGGLFSRPKFEGQNVVLGKVSTWMSENPEIIFCNAQTIDVPMISSTKIDSQRMSYSNSAGHLIRFIRVVYLKPPEITVDIPQTAFQPPPPPIYLSTRIFNIGSSNYRNIDKSMAKVKKSLSDFFWQEDWFKDEKLKWRFLSAESINVYFGKSSDLKEGIDCSFQTNLFSQDYSYSSSDCHNKDIFNAIRVYYDVGHFNKNNVIIDECETKTRKESSDVRDINHGRYLSVNHNNPRMNARTRRSSHSNLMQYKSEHEHDDMSNKRRLSIPDLTGITPLNIERMSQK